MKYEKLKNSWNKDCEQTWKKFAIGSQRAFSSLNFSLQRSIMALWDLGKRVSGTYPCSYFYTQSQKLASRREAGLTITFVGWDTFIHGRICKRIIDICQHSGVYYLNRAYISHCSFSAWDVSVHDLSVKYMKETRNLRWNTLPE